MKQTTNYALNKPDGNDLVDISVLNTNMDIFDTQIKALDTGKAAVSHNHSAANITSGTLPVARGGTGQTTAAGIRNSLGLGNTTGAVPIANGGTGATSAAAARTALGLGKALTFTGAVTGTYDGTAVKTINIPESGGKRTCRFVIGTSTAGWTTKDCDYLCDGTADHEEINNAIQALPATGGEIVILDGTYVISGAITINKDSVTLSGASKGAIIKRSYRGLNIVKISSCTGSVVQNLTIDGNGKDHVNDIGIYMHSSAESTIRCNDIINGRYGIYAAASCNNIFEGNIVSGHKEYGIQIREKSNYNVISHNLAANNGCHAIDVIDCECCIISGNKCIDSASMYSGINVHSLSTTAKHILIGNICTGNNYGINCYGEGCVITGNICENNNFMGLAIEKDNCMVIGNRVCNNAEGIYLSLSKNSSVIGNVANNNDSVGIWLNNSSRCNIIGNSCIRGTGLSSDYTAHQHTIQIDSSESQHNLISNNLILGKNYINEGGSGNTFTGNKYN